MPGNGHRTRGMVRELQLRLRRIARVEGHECRVEPGLHGLAECRTGEAARLEDRLVRARLSLVRGMALRTLWDNDPKWFDELFAVWRRMIKIFLECQHPKARAR